jgi:methionyl-tRNA formyltransferase
MSSRPEAGLDTAAASVVRPLRVAFAGTPEFARVALDAIVQAGWPVVRVWTQPDRPAGRGMKLQASPVKTFALGHDIPVDQPQALRLDGRHAAEASAARAAMTEASPDVMVVAAYGLILPDWVLALPRLGCLNIHGSLLPRWRGAAPIHRAIEAGDAHSGITIMQMDAGLDTGPMLLAESLPIPADATTGSLHDTLAALGARLIVEALGRLAAGQLVPRPQPAEGISYAHKIDKAEAMVDWGSPAAVIERRLRAFNPFPGASTLLGGEPIKLWSARPVDGQGVSGTVLKADEAGLVVACGEGALCLTELQRPGGRRQPVGAFLAARPVPVGSVLGTSA